MPTYDDKLRKRRTAKWYYCCINWS